MTDIEPRRFRLYALVTVMAFAALAYDWITGAQYVQLLIGLLGGS